MNVGAPYQNQNQNIYSQNQPLGRKSIPGGPQSMFAPVQQSIPAPIQSQQPTWNTAPTKQAYTGAANPPYGGGVVTSQPYGASTFTPTIPAPPQAQPTSNDPYGQYGQSPLTPSVPPPPPTSATTGSRPSSVGPHSRSKYILDPSVKSGPSYGSGYSQNQYGAPPQPQTFPAPGGFPAQASYQVNIYITLMFNEIYQKSCISYL